MTYRGIDVSRSINEILSDKCLNINKLSISICRFIWGDRNMRYWQIVKQKNEPNPDLLTDNDQKNIQRRKGRHRILNNKDPLGVILFKSYNIYLNDQNFLCIISICRSCW